jgi:hypothetical protein
MNSLLALFLVNLARDLISFVNFQNYVLILFVAAGAEDLH